MFLFLRRKLHYQIRARRWVFFLIIGLVMMCFGVIITALSAIILFGRFGNGKKFHPVALGITALTAFLFSYYWFSLGLKVAFDILDIRDHSISTKIREFVFKRAHSAEKLFRLLFGWRNRFKLIVKGYKRAAN